MCFMTLGKFQNSAIGKINKAMFEMGLKDAKDFDRKSKDIVGGDN